MSTAVLGTPAELDQPDTASPAALAVDLSVIPTDVAVEDIPEWSVGWVEVSVLVEHTGNVRRDLRLGRKFLSSIKNRGVRFPLLVTRHPDGRLEVRDGHRRLGGAVKVGREKVPCLMIPPGQPGEDFMDMYTAGSDVIPLDQFEQADALFSASQAGMSVTKIRKSSGLGTEKVKAALAVAQMPDEVREKVYDAGYEFNLLQLAELHGLGSDLEAVERVSAEAHAGRFDYALALEHQRRAEDARLDQARKEVHGRLTEQGVIFCDSLPLVAEWLEDLTAEEGGHVPIAADDHATCPGHLATWQSWEEATVTYLCADPETHGHYPIQAAPTSTSVPRAMTGTATATTSDRATFTPPGRHPQKLVIQANKDWTAARAARIAFWTRFAGQHSAPSPAAAFITSTLAELPQAMVNWASQPKWELLGSMLGMGRDAWRDKVQAKIAARAPKAQQVMQLLVVAAAYEASIDNRTWRTDDLGRETKCPRAQAAAYLRLMTELDMGPDAPPYAPAPIEQAVLDGVAYTGTDPARPALDTVQPAEATDLAPATESGSGDAGTAPENGGQPTPATEPEHGDAPGDQPAPDEDTAERVITAIVSDPAGQRSGEDELGEVLATVALLPAADSGCGCTPGCVDFAVCPSLNGELARAA
ncbi:ParB/RepB/Spo0J family partition protein [Longispora sp. NPDC051575]|uniref:ParB/RepB/Spo0J family partition protein n=1 Tax=Longispora sp. NPDC051575 TaxID=3154943 RepID=UPI00342C0956